MTEKTRDYLEDFEVGETIVSPARTMTESDIVNFAMMTGDWNPLHTDAEFAKTTPFGERIAHGLLVLSIGSSLGFRLGPNAISPKSFIALYGFEAIRFKAPTKIGDTIRLEASVDAIDDKDDARGILVMNNQIINQDGVTCVEYTTRYLCGRRPS